MVIIEKWAPAVNFMRKSLASAATHCFINVFKMMGQAATAATNARRNYFSFKDCWHGAVGVASS